ncbi:MAG TPA: CIA30 family protein [Kofleriaceae bacterium]|nr:CIA30 family protein [Kofleriaceae bacterium]
MACIGTETLLDLASDKSPARLSRFEHHLDACDECRRLIAELAGLSWMRVACAHDETATTEPQRGTLEVGRVIDRYILIDVIGSGGMGIVYAAYDPRLDRKIALKVLRPDRDGDERRARLMREAQALAQLRHPNVVAIHDAGETDGQVFVAMELVEGTTLREWLRAERRDWRGIIAMFLQALHGLAAAHAAGIVHRDFKPDNVLIGDGRAQVADFGLAITATTSGELAGTPAYMSPEQRRGDVLTSASDQYSFCVALKDALSGTRPPARITAALERGMAPAPADRHVSMEALARALRWRSPIRIPAIITGAACIGLAGFAALSSTRSEAGPTCSVESAEAKLASVWDREQVKQLVLATNSANAPAILASIEQKVDAYGNAWIAERTDACAATYVRGEQSPERLDQRNACLDTRLQELATRITALRDISAANLATGPAIFDDLVSPSACSSRASLAHESAPPSMGAVSTFDDGSLASRFGAGWAVSTDVIMGGHSTGKLSVVDGGANGTPNALEITGTVSEGGAISWAGAMFSPGASPMMPVDLSAHHFVRFAARGDGGSYNVLLFSQTKGDLPAFRPFVAGTTWTQYRFPLAEFDGVNPADIKGLLFASSRQGPFALQIDEIEFE